MEIGAQNKICPVVLQSFSIDLTGIFILEDMLSRFADTAARILPMSNKLLKLAES